MNQLVVGEMGLSGKWLVGETEFGETSFRRRGIRRNGVGEMGVDETAVGEMTCNQILEHVLENIYKPLDAIISASSNWILMIYSSLDSSHWD